jgi:hypothetical protein
MAPVEKAPALDLSEAPAPPAHLPEAIATKWKTLYVKALAQAKIDAPDNPRLQRIAALKAANTLLTVPAPKSAADIDALESWQAIKRYDLNGNRVCITADGRKYTFPIGEAAGK